MKVLSYNDLNHKDSIYFKYSLVCCMLEYFKEKHRDTFRGNLDSAIEMLDNMMNYGYFIYFTVDNTKEDIVTGFVVTHVDSQWGMLEDYLVCDYMYVHPSYRKSKSTMLLFNTVGKVAVSLGLDVVGLGLVDGDNNCGNIMKVGGVPIGELYSIPRTNFMDKYKRYMKGYT